MRMQCNHAPDLTKEVGNHSPHYWHLVAATTHMVTNGWCTSYWNAILFKFRQCLSHWRKCDSLLWLWDWPVIPDVTLLLTRTLFSSKTVISNVKLIKWIIPGFMLRILIIWVIATFYTGVYEHHLLHYDILILTIMEYEWSNDVVNKILGIISLNLAGHKYLWINVSHTDVEKTTHCDLCSNYERCMFHLGTERHQSSQIQSTHILVNGIQIKEPDF